jgi:hypothetical protein
MFYDQSTYYRMCEGIFSTTLSRSIKKSNPVLFVLKDPCKFAQQTGELYEEIKMRISSALPSTWVFFHTESIRQRMTILLFLVNRWLLWSITKLA